VIRIIIIIIMWEAHTIFASKQTGLAVNADKTKCMFMSGDQNVGRSDNMKIDKIMFVSVEHKEYSGNRNGSKFCSRGY
jgi:hypothetical protein